MYLIYIYICMYVYSCLYLYYVYSIVLRIFIKSHMTIVNILVVTSILLEVKLVHMYTLYSPISHGYISINVYIHMCMYISIIIQSIHLKYTSE